jgi:hypothetical protein
MRKWIGCPEAGRLLCWNAHQVVLPAEVLDGIEAQVLDVTGHAGLLLASGQHLKRGVLDADARRRLLRIYQGTWNWIRPTRTP